MFCNHCGVEHPDYARICRNCGRPFQRRTDALTSLCSHCQAPNPTDANYCQQCGQPLHQEAEAPVPDFFVPPPSLSSAPTPGVPSVQGAPQAGGVPMVQNTSPMSINPDAAQEAFSSSHQELASPHHTLHAPNPQSTLSPQSGQLSSAAHQPTPSSLSPQTPASQPGSFAPAHQPPTPSGLSLQATTPQQAPSQASSAPKKATSLKRSFSGASAAKTIIIVVAAVAVVAAGGLAAASRFLSHPQPLIGITSSYNVGNTPAGTTGTVLHISGQKFSSNSAITILLDGHAAPGNAGTRSDANGNFSTNVTITNAWSPGTHTLTATDASNNSTQNSVSVTIVQPGQANTPGPNGAPPDDATFTLIFPVNGRNNAIDQPFPGNQEVLHIIGHPDPAGGTVCLDRDNGQQFSGSYVLSTGVPFMATYSLSCQGSYKNGKISFTETLLSALTTSTDGSGSSCTLLSPQLNQQVTGSYTGNGTFTGTWTYGPVPASNFRCTNGWSFTYITDHGTWTGTVSGLQK